MCAVMHDFFVAADSITYDHLIKLTEIVVTLDANGMVHGDLRIPNILMIRDYGVRLIDFDWSGKKGAAKFPPNANHHAFGPFAAP